MHHLIKQRFRKTEVSANSVSSTVANTMANTVTSSVRPDRGLPTDQSSRGVRRQFGQGMTEYIVVVALIAIAAVTASGFFGARVQAQFVSMGKEISGEQGAPTGGVAAPTPAPAKLGNYIAN